MPHHAIPSVAVVDDDDSVLKALRRLLSAAGFDARGREIVRSRAPVLLSMTLIDDERLLVTQRRPSGAIARHCTGPSCGPSVDSVLQVMGSQIRTVPSQLAVASQVPVRR